MHVLIQIDAAILAEAMASCGRVMAELSRLPPMARTVVIPNELDAGAIDLTPTNGGWG